MEPEKDSGALLQISDAWRRFLVEWQIKYIEIAFFAGLKNPSKNHSFVLYIVIVCQLGYYSYVASVWMMGHPTAAA